MRPSSLAAARPLLEQLRSGAVTFDAAARGIRPALELRAERFLRVWSWSGQMSVGTEDLVQEMLLALWRAVDSWDPARADLIRYVDAQLGRACQRRLRKTAGYPDPRRRTPARQVSVDAAVVQDVLERGAPASVTPEEVVFARRQAEGLLRDLSGLDRHAVELLLEGRSLEQATEAIYADRGARIAYRMDSLPHARRLVGAAVRRATSAAEAVTSARG